MSILLVPASNRPRPALAGVLLASLLCLSSSLHAVLFDPLSIEALTAQSDVVLQGTVLSRTCQRDPAGRIFTRVEIAVSDVWKGAVSGTPFLVVHGGGVVGDEQSAVSGQVEYQVGEEVVAFVVRNERSEGVTLGLKQGKFHVWQDKRGVKLAASPFHGNGANAAQQGAAMSSVSRPSGAGLLSLSQLKQRVQEARR